MRLSFTRLVLVAALLLLAVPALAQEKQAMPPVLLEQLGLHPDCTVLESRQVGDVETCQLNCGDLHPKKAATHYKRQMDGNGFTKTSLGGVDGGAQATGEKQGAVAKALAVKADGHTEVLLTIDNIAVLGGTPVTAQADQPAEESAEAVAEPATQPEEPAEAKNTEVMGQGLADEIWELVDPRPGDVLLEEMQLHGHPVAIFTTDGPVEAVLNYFQEALSAKEWMKLTHMVESDGGMVIMVTQGQQFQVICEQDMHAGHPGLGYSIMLAKKPQ